MEFQEADPPIRRKPMNRRLAQDLRALLPALGLGVCFGAATMGIVAVESDPLGARSMALARVDTPPPVGAAWSGFRAASAIEAPGLRVPTPPEIVAGHVSQDGDAPVETQHDAEPSSASSSASSTE